jgi:hypothetical protein
MLFFWTNILEIIASYKGLPKFHPQVPWLSQLIVETGSHHVPNDWHPLKTRVNVKKLENMPIYIYINLLHILVITSWSKT